MAGRVGEVAQNEYWVETQRPLTCLVFLTPFLVIYEFGVIWISQRESVEVRNGADYWLRASLDRVGLQADYWLPALVASGLLLWHVGRRYPWKLDLATLAGMLAESFLFAFALIVLGQIQDVLFRHILPSPSATPLAIQAVMAGRLISFVGAGVYEEVLFRLCLLPACFASCRLLTTGRFAAIAAVLLTSAVFAAAHHVGPMGDDWSVYRFSFRMVAGSFFAALFLMRGFGITVGAHAVYDVCVGIVMA